ncbi:MAG: hypothetical protein ABIQ11_00850 [Saprospiraceae bacterium]
MRIIFLVILFVFAFFPKVTCQKFLIIERSGTPKTERIPMFDHLTFQLKDDDNIWYTRQIFDLNADAQLVLLGDTWFPISDISRIHLKRQRVLASVIGGALQVGGASMILGDLYYTVRNNHRYTDGGIEFGLINILVGTGIRSIIGPIKYRLGKKTRLRVIDVTINSNSKT